ncbi:hypothetical protein [Paraflavitalea pollutisoli]|uniref:hypothetical protein n=1 Tax=Paraflavitalea pollutisoli TaxID=3034143 RepID=UPI0023ED0A2B|nr:hypothetical protein [Paraflavitalea sp. H1-2-19X]
MPGNLINIKVGGEVDPNLGRSAKAGSDALNGLGRAAAGAVGPLNALGSAAEHTFDEVAAGAAAMDRISAEIDQMAAAAIRANQTFEGMGASAAKAITPISTLEDRLEQLQSQIGRTGTVQGAAFLGVQFDIVNRNLEETRALINQATASAVGLSRAFNTIASSSSSLNRLSPAIKPVLTDLKVLPPAANAAAASLEKLRRSGGQASTTLTDFSRIIQDSPYGFVAIGNNITQVTDSFGNLVRSAGGVGPAFKQLFSSATGFGGIGLAISVVTSAITFASVGLSAWTRGFQQNEKAAEEARKATEEFVKSLKSAGELAGRAAGGVEGQITQVKALASAVLNTNLAYTERTAALRELSQINKNYFGELTLETAQTGKLTAAVNEYTQALVNQAVVKGFESEIGRISTELFTQEKAFKKAETAYKQLKTELDKVPEGKAREGMIGLVLETEAAEKAFLEQRDAIEKARSSLADIKGAMKAAVIEGLKFTDLTKARTEATDKEDKALKLLRKELEAYQTQLAKLTKLREGGVLPTFRENDAFELQRKIADTLKKIDDRELLLKIRAVPEIDPEISEIELEKDLGTLSTRLGSKLELKPVFRIRPTFETNQFSPAAVFGTDGIPTSSFDKMIAAAVKGAALLRQQLKVKYAESIRGALLDGAVEGFAGLGDAFGQAIGNIFGGESVGSALAAAGESILKIIGGVLQDIGKQIIVASTLVQALKKALATLFANPTAALGVGIGLVALGGILKSIKFNVPKFADGVSNFGGGFAMVGERGPEIVRLPGGSDVIPNEALGGMAVALVPSIRFSGASFQIMLEQVDRQRRRMG